MVSTSKATVHIPIFQHGSQEAIQRHHPSVDNSWRGRQHPTLQPSTSKIQAVPRLAALHPRRDSSLSHLSFLLPSSDVIFSFRTRHCHVCCHTGTATILRVSNAKTLLSSKTTHSSTQATGQSSLAMVSTNSKPQSWSRRARKKGG